MGDVTSVITIPDKFRQRAKGLAIEKNVKK